LEWAVLQRRDGWPLLFAASMTTNSSTGGKYYKTRQGQTKSKLKENPVRIPGLTNKNRADPDKGSSRL
jgi:hypothetical protein